MLIRKPWIYLLVIIVIHGTQIAIAADKAQLQRGAVFFMNYCSGCHSLKYLRYERIEHNLDFRLVASPGIGPVVTNTLESDAHRWFGLLPPDLSNIARQHSPSWLYAYLNSFYPDKSRPFGTNNKLVPYVAMPNVLGPLEQRVKLGVMSQNELDGMVRDVVAFLAYVAEPQRKQQCQLGALVLGFLGVLWLLLYILNGRPSRMM